MLASHIILNSHSNARNLPFKLASPSHSIPEAVTSPKSKKLTRKFPGSVKFVILEGVGEKVLTIGENVEVENETTDRLQRYAQPKPLTLSLIHP